MRRAPIKALLVAAVVAGAAATPAAAALRAPGAEGPLRTERLSNEKTVSRWANAALTAPVRSAPRRSARALDRLHYWTEDGRPEVYLALESRRAGGRVWVRVRLPGRPNGRTGWVPRGALGHLHLVRTQLVIDRRSVRATLFERGRTIWSGPVGIGAGRTPTPAGRFYVRELLRGDGGVYGPWAFGTSAYSVLSEWPRGGVIGIHGTNEPGLLPGRVSHGCVRVRNEDIRRLVKLMPIGTPVRIR